jgi:hypothetical protein
MATTPSIIRANNLGMNEKNYSTLSTISYYRFMKKLQKLPGDILHYIFEFHDMIDYANGRYHLRVNKIDENNERKKKLLRLPQIIVEKSVTGKFEYWTKYGKQYSITVFLSEKDAHKENDPENLFKVLALRVCLSRFDRFDKTLVSNEDGSGSIWMSNITFNEMWNGNEWISNDTLCYSDQGMIKFDTVLKCI